MEAANGGMTTAETRAGAAAEVLAGGIQLLEYLQGRGGELPRQSLPVAGREGVAVARPSSLTCRIHYKSRS